MEAQILNLPGKSRRLQDTREAILLDFIEDDVEQVRSALAGIAEYVDRVAQRFDRTVRPIALENEGQESARALNKLERLDDALADLERRLQQAAALG